MNHPVNNNKIANEGINYMWNHPVKKEHAKEVQGFEMHPDGAVTTSTPSPRPDGWINKILKLGRLDVDLYSRIVDIVRQELTTQHHKDIEAFRGMIGKDEHVTSGGDEEHAPQVDYSAQDRNVFRAELRSALSTFASTDTGKENV